MPSSVIPRLDLGISFQEMRGWHPDFRLKSSRQRSPGDGKIKSWHDGRVVGNTYVTRRNVLRWRLWNRRPQDWRPSNRPLPLLALQLFHLLTRQADIVQQMVMEPAQLIADAALPPAGSDGSSICAGDKVGEALCAQRWAEIVYPEQARLA